MKQFEAYVLTEEEEKSIMGGHWIYDEVNDDWYWVE